MAKKAYIGVDGVARVDTPYISSDGVARYVKRSYIGVDAIARQCYVRGKPAAEYAIGDSVYLMVGGVATEFLIVHRGNPDESFYDASCDGLWLSMKDIHTMMVWGGTTNVLPDTDGHAYLNGDFFASLGAVEQETILEVNIPYVYSGSGNLDHLETLAAKVFLLGLGECGFTVGETNIDGEVDQPKDGTCLDYFQGTVSTDSKRIAYYEGAATAWILRTIRGNTTITNWGIYSSGGRAQISATDVQTGIRPVVILPHDVLFDPDTNLLIGL